MNDIEKLVESLGFIEEFIETSTALSTERNVPDLLGKVLVSARKFCNCEAGRLYVFDATKRHLELRISQWDDRDICNSWYSPQNVTEAENEHFCSPLLHCAVTGLVVLIDDVYQGSGFNTLSYYRHDEINNVTSHSVILVPLLDHQLQCLGVLELINAKDTHNRRYVSFAPLEAIICAFAAQAAVCINNAQLINANDHLIGILKQTNQRLEDENKKLKAQAAAHHNYEIIGDSEPMQRVFALMNKAVNTPVSILLTGETGTGKEVFAKAIHNSSQRKTKQFVTQNCAALPEQLLESELFGYKKGAFTGAVSEKMGLLELADGGTLFLDEIGDMPLNLQTKLLRVLQNSEFRPLGSTQSKRVNIRIVAATHRNLLQKIEAGEFREDLYFRLNVFPIHLPPLRQRGSDIKLLLDFFIEKYATQYHKDVRGVSPAALDLLFRYPFPGNVRELQNVVERGVLLCEHSGALLPEHLSDQIQASAGAQLSTQPRLSHRHKVSIQKDGPYTTLKNVVNAYEIEVIEQHLKANNWNQTRTAETLHIPRRTLIDKMSRYNIKAPLKRKSTHS